MNAKIIATAFLASSLAACAISPASQHVADMQAAANRFGLECPAAVPVVVYGDTAGEAFAPVGPLKGGTVVMPARYSDPAQDASPRAHDVMAHEVAHTCGADETQARAFTRYWKGTF